MELFSLALLIGAVTIPTVAVVGTIAWLAPTRRPAIVRRYPLVLATALIVAPHLYALAWAVYFGADFDRSPDDGVNREPWMVALGVVGIVLCATVVVEAVRAARGRCASGPYLPAIIGFTVGGAVTALLLRGGLDSPGIVIYLVLLTLASGTNGLLAQWVNAARRDAADEVLAGVAPGD